MDSERGPCSVGQSCFFPEEPGSIAPDVSQHGNKAVEEDFATGFPRAFLGTPSRGILDLRELFVAEYRLGDALDGFSFRAAEKISDDGKTMAGSEGWMARPWAGSSTLILSLPGLSGISIQPAN